jgi:hypothetical protein
MSADGLAVVMMTEDSRGQQHRSTIGEHADRGLGTAVAFSSPEAPMTRSPCWMRRNHADLDGMLSRIAMPGVANNFARRGGGRVC